MATRKSYYRGPWHGSRLLELRVTLGLRQDELAVQAGMNTDRIKMLEWGRRRPTTRQFKALCAALKVPAEAFAVPASENADRLHSKLSREAAVRRNRVRRLVHAGEQAVREQRSK